MNERLKEIRKTLKLTQVAFGEKIGLKQTVIGQMEQGIRNITERTIISICREFNVNEQWFREGKGDMFDKTSQTIIEELTNKYDLDKLDQVLIIEYAKLQPEHRLVIKEYLNNIINTIQKIELYEKEEHEEVRLMARGGKSEIVKIPEANKDKIEKEIKRLSKNNKLPDWL